MFQIVYKKKALKALVKLPKGIRTRIRDELMKVAQSPQAYQGDWKPLTGCPHWRLRIGDYRAICQFNKGELVLLVLNVGPRGDIYK